MKRTFSYQDISREVTVGDYLSSRSYSKGCLTFLKQNQGLSVNGEAAKTNTMMQPGDTLTVVFNEKEDNQYIADSDLEPDIIYEDEDILIINKPPFMPVHPSRLYKGVTLANIVAGYYHRRHETFTFRCCSRLDRDTSGPVLLAKNMLAGHLLSQMVINHQIQKEYTAIVCHPFDVTGGTVDLPIFRPDSRSIRRITDREKGLPALTEYKVVKQNENYALIILHLATGRTHQIRVHMNAIGHPLAGDLLYNPDDRLLNRQALHVSHLSFSHPISSENLSFDVPLPPDMADAVHHQFE